MVRRRALPCDGLQRSNRMPTVPIVFRTMIPDPDGLPRAGASLRTLGARPGVDIPVDGDGNVKPRTGGMSVTADDPKRIPKPVRPRSLGGESRDTLFSMDTAVIPPSLVVRADKPAPPGGIASLHRVVEPSEACSFGAYQFELHGTRKSWRAA